MYKLAFVILTWNSEKYICSCLQSIYSLDSTLLQGEIIIIDNGSKDSTLSKIDEISTQHGKETTFVCSTIRLERNYGTTHSRNIGIKQAMHRKDIQYVCILDSDTVVNTKALITLIETLDDNHLCAIVGPRLHNSDGIYQRSGRNIPTAIEKFLKVIPVAALRKRGEQMESSIGETGTGAVSVGYLLSACWMMRKELFVDVGLLDEKIFYAPEDVDYCIRCIKKGYKILYCYDADIIHEWQRLSRKKLISRHNYEHIKGLGYLFLKHGYLFSNKHIEK